jgi:hypothetical protein
LTRLEAISAAQHPFAFEQHSHGYEDIARLDRGTRFLRLSLVVSYEKRTRTLVSIARTPFSLLSDGGIHLVDRFWWPVIGERVGPGTRLLRVGLSAPAPVFARARTSTTISSPFCSTSDFWLALRAAACVDLADVGPLQEQVDSLQEISIILHQRPASLRVKCQR